jgi:CubicO group peptidase (beta-lactamase class C family)
MRHEIGRKQGCGWRQLLAAGLCAALAPFVPACRQAPPVAPAEQTVAAAPALAPRLAAEIETVARAEFERQQFVGLSLAVVKDGVVHAAHFGFEDREKQVPSSDATMYRWASISKPVTAVVALQLANEGRLDLERDVHAYVSEFPAQRFTITSRQLLCHQGGIVHYTNGPVIPLPPRAGVAHPYEDAVDALATFAGSPLVAEPGTQYAYSTHGYVLLGAVLQRAGGRSFETLVQERVAAPLGLTTLRPDKQWIAIPHRTIGYRRDAQGAIVPSEDDDVSWKLAGGGFISCVGDLARFGAGMLGDELVDRATRERMWTAQATSDGKVTDYGLGFRIDTHAGRRLILHGGSQEKTRTRLLILPEDGVVVALMCNSEWADLAPLGKQLLTALAPAS